MQDNSLYMKIMKAENNAAIIRDVIVAEMDPYLCRIIKKLVGENFQEWACRKVFLEDLKKYKENPESSYLSICVFPFYKLISNLKNPPSSIKRLNSKQLKNLTYNHMQKELSNNSLEFAEFNLNNIDTAGYIKIIKNRVNYSFGQVFLDALDTLSELRNNYEGHLTNEVKLNCTSDTVKEKAQSLSQALNSVVEAFKNINDAVLSYCRQELIKAEKHLANVIKIMNDIAGNEVIKDSSQKYSAKDLFNYTIFMVYPNMKSDKFRRFCNDELKTPYALKGQTLYTDIGTISFLEAYATSKNESIKSEAKRLIKELFKPMHSAGILKVINPENDNQSDDYLSTSNLTSQDQFLDMLGSLNGRFCVITDDLTVANKVWKLNEVKDRKTFSAVAVKVSTTSSVVPFYK